MAGSDDEEGRNAVGRCPPQVGVGAPLWGRASIVCGEE